MSARDDAVDLMEAEDARHNYVCDLGRLLDVVPADVLRRMADEREQADGGPAADTATQDPARITTLTPEDIASAHEAMAAADRIIPVELPAADTDTDDEATPPRPTPNLLATQWLPSWLPIPPADTTTTETATLPCGHPADNNGSLYWDVNGTPCCKACWDAIDVGRQT